MQVPAHLLKRQSRGDDFTGGIGSGIPPHLSITDNRFTLVDGSGNERPIQTFHLDVCVLGSNPAASRVFYDPAKKYTKGDNAPPLCFSDNGSGPSRQSSTPQAPTCAVCPHAEWGSAVSQMTGRGIPACQSGKKLAFIVPGDADDIVYMLKVPPASLKNWAKFVKTLAANAIGGRPAEPPDVIVRLEFESQGVLKFNAVSFVDEDTFNRAEQVYATDAINEVTGRNDVAIDPSRQIGAPVQANALAGPQPQRMAPPQPPAPPPLAFPPQGEVIPPAAVEPPKPARKPRAKAPEAPAPSNDDGLAVPGFLRRTQEAPKAPEPSFGMVVNAPEPSNDVNDALTKAFALPGV